MTLSDIDKLLEDNGLKVCAVCRTPFKPYHTRQKTCGNDECKRAFKNKYLKDYRLKRIEQNPEAYREQHRIATKRCRERQKKRKAGYFETLETIKNLERQENITGIDYGKRQVEKTLASVPKIDISMIKEK